ncbi:methyl-accepting chemotaxis protein [Ponticaulis profundi]|uniref:Methyl-accepting chemotaxis protein n=1 Tax=Ponticaulis profundi TaxID=2665222 RepID=A0ABW1SFC6_9PROT
MATVQQAALASDTFTGKKENNTQSLASYLLPDDPNGARAKAVWAQLKPALPDVLSVFYSRLAETPNLKGKLGNDPKTPTRLGELQTNHWERVFTGEVDSGLETEAKKIGSAHVRIGLTSDWFIASYGRILMDAIPIILKVHRFTPQRAAEAIQVMIARIFLDMALANESYSSQITDKEAIEWREDNDYQNLRTIADSISDLNELTLNLTVLSDSFRKSNSASESVAAAVEEMVASIQQLSDTSQSASNDANETNAALGEGIESVSSARSAISTVSEAAEQSNRSLSSLKNAANEIGAFMEIIQSISDQTNLLALNATIEAARAGDAGRGFAVVANEVKALAGQAASASDDVAKRIQTLQSEIDRISHNFENTKTAIDSGEQTLDEANTRIESAGTQMGTVANRMSEVASILEQQEGSTLEISGHVSGIAEMSRENATCIVDIGDLLQRSNDHLSKTANQWFKNSSGRSLCQMAKIDHVLFKKRVVDTVMGRENWKASEVPSNHACRLGKWYDNIDDAELKRTDAFRKLSEPHKHVHDSAVKTLEAHERGDHDAALAALKELDESSRAVLQSLNDISDYLHSKESIEERRKRERVPVYGEKIELRSDGKVIKASVIDEGPRGIGIDGVPAHEVGNSFEINYNGTKKGVVRWSSGKRGGIEFEDN